MRRRWQLALFLWTRERQPRIAASPGARRAAGTSLYLTLLLGLALLLARWPGKAAAVLSLAALEIGLGFGSALLYIAHLAVDQPALPEQLHTGPLYDWHPLLQAVPRADAVGAGGDGEGPHHGRTAARARAHAAGAAGQDGDRPVRRLDDDGLQQSRRRELARTRLEQKLGADALRRDQPRHAGLHDCRACAADSASTSVPSISRRAARSTTSAGTISRTPTFRGLDPRLRRLPSAGTDRLPRRAVARSPDLHDLSGAQDPDAPADASRCDTPRPVRHAAGSRRGGIRSERSTRSIAATSTRSRRSTGSAASSPCGSAR